ncbi:hypothetical protein [Puia dinghuensis]|uniref:Uncharacterized protein n=1 Tax=Puia dinghuensis TaxID=1792502 RepID=A0A8J2UJ73_9BACT|nr:hypothetical protein [Puia dinghuensis]GGB25642.1 hypothetical protein GCM10011511_56980 [Puia dinghuensis]
MHLFLLIFYYIGCACAIAKMRFIRKSGIRPAILQALFAFHVAVGWLHNVIAWRYYPEHGDVWNNFRVSFLYRHRLTSEFNLWLSDNDTWTHISHNGMVYIQMLLNCFSFDHLDINTLLFAFPVFLGNIALFRVLRHCLPGDPLTAICVFLLPSVLFWTSVVHREAVLYMLLGFLVYNFQWLLAHGFDWRRAGYCLLCFLLIAYFRSAFAFTLLPALYAWILADKPRIRRKLLLAGVITGGLLTLFICPVLDIPGAIARQQQEFLGLEGHSRLPLPTLDGTWSSLLHILPAAIRNGWFEPLPGSGGQLIYWAFSLELLLIWAIVLLAIGRTLLRPKNPAPSLHALLPGAPRSPHTPPPGAPLSPREPLFNAFGVFSLLFALIGMLLIGILVPFAGAIVRYRSLYLLFLLAPFLHSLRTLPPFKTTNTWFSKNLFYRL